MEPLTLSEITEYCGGLLIQGTPAAFVTGVSTDTRTISEGDLYVALKGDRFDGHDYLKEAAEAGAAAVLVSRLPKSSGEIDCGLIRVQDTLLALQLLAKHYRDQLDLTVVAVTGSSGKTTTKDFLRAVLGERFLVNATEGNLNNHIGLPLTILRTEGNHECGIWEMGMNSPGEIEVLAELASPDVGVVTNVGVAHLEFMKTRDAIAREKGMLVEAVREDGCVVLAAEDDYLENLKGRSPAPVVTAGLDSGDLVAADLRMEDGGCAFVMKRGEERVDAFIPVVGKHMVKNALLAAGVGVHLGLTLGEIAAGLGKAKIAGGRLEQKEHGGITWLDDSYNANPESMRAAIETLESLPCENRRVAVLGAMAELGEEAEGDHRAVGEQLAQAGIDIAVIVGEAAAGIAAGARSAGLEAEQCSTHGDAVRFLEGELAAGDVVLLKGSRSSRMEKVLEEMTGS